MVRQLKRKRPLEKGKIKCQKLNDLFRQKNVQVDKDEAQASEVVAIIKAALKDIIAAFSSAENIAKLNEAKSNAGNDMLMYMQLVFPLATQIQIEVIQNYGFTSDREGLLQFTQAIQTMKKDNSEVLQMSEDLKQLLLPPLSLPYAQVSSS